MDNKEERTIAIQALRLAVATMLEAGYSEDDIKDTVSDVMLGVRHYGLEAVKQFAFTSDTSVLVLKDESEAS